MNHLKYKNYKAKNNTNEVLGAYNKHCVRYRQFIDFKRDNPYSGKELEFESLPTPRLRKNGSYHQLHESRNNKIKLKHFIENSQNEKKIKPLIKTKKSVI